MNSRTQSRSSTPNLVLVLALCLLVGFIGGYLFGQRGPISSGTMTAQGPCPHELGPEDEYIIAGFSCPAPACQDPLLTCHCDEAHQIKDRIKQELGQGKDGTEIRAELERQYGALLHKGG
ncbi:MAG: hypothetical protein AB1792_10970 [Candidatus Zixiibacteriota bacterium]